MGSRGPPRTLSLIADGLWGKGVLFQFYSVYLPATCGHRVPYTNLKGHKRERYEWGKRLVGKGRWKWKGGEWEGIEATTIRMYYRMCQELSNKFNIQKN